MPLTFIPPPGDAWLALQSGLQRVATAQRNAPRGGGALALASAPQAVKPHPVYTLGLNDLAAGKGLEAAQLSAWRYLIVDNHQVRQAAEVIPDPSGGSRFGSLTNGFVAGAEQAFALADSLPEVVNGNYEIRSLLVPALYVMALWLKDKNGTQDRFILLPPVFPPLRAQTPYAASDLLTILHQLAGAKVPLEQAIKEGEPTLPQKPRP